MNAATSSISWSSRTNRCASSCVNWRTRMMPLERAMRLIAVAAAEFGHADRQVAITLDPLAKDEDVRGAVHRFERHQVGGAAEDFAFVLGIGNFVGHDEHVLAIFAPMPGLFPLARVHQLRRLDLGIARRIEPTAHIRLQLAPKNIALGMPEHRPLRLGLKVETGPSPARSCGGRAWPLPPASAGARRAASG